MIQLTYVYFLIGIVTRTPLEKRMRTARNGTGWKCRIRYKDHKGQQVNMEITNPSEVGDAVKDGKNKLFLSIYSE